MKHLKLPMLSVLFAFFLATLLGLTLRSAFAFELPSWFVYRNVQHAHSHVALLGWLFGINFIAIIYAFDLSWINYKRLFWVTMISVLGMLITFPIYGYDKPSILFSLIHILCSYVFTFKVWTEISARKELNLARRFLKASLIFLLISSAGTLALGPLIANGFNGSAIYYASIQFYLHFQFNGWLIFALLALLFQILNKNGIGLDIKRSHYFFWTLTVSTILTFALAITWSTPRLEIFIINSTGVIIQLISLLFFLGLLKSKVAYIRRLPKYTFFAFSVSLIALVLKISIQSIVAIPFMAEISYTIRNFVIGFIHLLMLGCLSMFALGMISIIFNCSLSKKGTWLFIFGILSTELLLFLQGLMMWSAKGFLPHYYLLMVLASGFIVIGLAVILLQFIRLRIPQA